MLAHDDDIMPDNKSEIPGAPTLDPALNHPHYNKRQTQTFADKEQHYFPFSEDLWENFTPSHQKVSVWIMNLWVITNYARGGQFLSCGPCSAGWCGPGLWLDRDGLAREISWSPHTQAPVTHGPSAWPECTQLHWAGPHSVPPLSGQSPASGMHDDMMTWCQSDDSEDWPQWQ